ncbi:MAG: hypothetical protein MZW92_48875 [Comamonadaceae bacterium]|nr:hypothetical protein [Comamonadaceae bacterium]
MTAVGWRGCWIAADRRAPRLVAPRRARGWRRRSATCCGWLVVAAAPRRRCANLRALLSADARAASAARSARRLLPQRRPRRARSLGALARQPRERLEAWCGSRASSTLSDPGQPAADHARAALRGPRRRRHAPRHAGARRLDLRPAEATRSGTR